MDESLEALNELNQKNLNLLSSLSMGTILGGLVFGVLGIWLFRKGQKEKNLRLTLIAIALLVYPVFTMDPWLIWGIGIGLCALAYYLRDDSEKTHS